MSVTSNNFQVEWRFFKVTPWYRRVLSVLFGIGVIAISLLALSQGSSMWVLGGVSIMAMASLLLIYGIEIQYIELGSSRIQFNIKDD
jgi:hypothetical protein